MERAIKGNTEFFTDIPPLVRKGKGTIKFWKKNPNCPKWIRKIVSKKQVQNLQREKYEQ